MQQTVHLGHLDASPASRAVAKYHWGNKQLEIGTGQEMDFIGELIKWTILEGHNSDWILADIGVINVSHTGRCNLICDVHTAVWCMSLRTAPDSEPVGERGQELLIKACGLVLSFCPHAKEGYFHVLPSIESHRQFHLKCFKKGV